MSLSKKRVRLGLDAFGGDHAPDIVVEGAHLIALRYPDTRFTFFGKKNKLTPLMQKYPVLAQAEIVHCKDVITSDCDMRTALRLKKTSSMGCALQSVANGQTDACVSAGHTGAFMALSKMILGTIAPIDRPAIATFIPNLKNESLLLDLGANVDCSAQQLTQFALMGDAFARIVLGIEKPRLALMNIGSEIIKGNKAVREAFDELNEMKSLNFRGFCEGDDITKGDFDVIISDGFVGNVTLKTIEGFAQFFAEFLRRTAKSSLLARIGFMLARWELKRMFMRIDPRCYNGAMLLGLNHVAVKSHGGSDGFAFAHAIEEAIDMVHYNLNHHLKTALLSS